MGGLKRLARFLEKDCQKRYFLNLGLKVESLSGFLRPDKKKIRLATYGYIVLGRLMTSN